MLTRIVQALAWLVLAGLFIQFYLAGAALFGAATFQPHRTLGDSLAVAILLLLIVTLIARPGRRVVAAAAALLALTILQIFLPTLRAGSPWIAALHVLNAVVLVAVTVRIARSAREVARPSAAPGSQLGIAEWI